jgi:hypothetical protein
MIYTEFYEEHMEVVLLKDDFRNFKNKQTLQTQIVL